MTQFMPLQIVWANGSARSKFGIRRAPSISRAWVLPALLVLVGCGGGGGGGNEEPTCTAGVTQGFTGSLDWVAGASGVGAGADGQGGVGIQPALGVSPIVGARVTVRRADGTAIGRADTGADGRVTLKACDAAGPFLIEVEGAASANYFDAAKGALGGNVPFGEGELLRAVIPALTGNIGVTPATEAVAQRLLGRASAGASQILPATAAIDEAYRQVLERAWRPLWPQPLAVENLTLMPGRADSATLADRPADRYALALASLGQAAAQFNAALLAPTLSAARQFAADAADGKVDGRDANGVPVAAIGQVAYDPGRLRDGLDAALAVASRLHATQALQDRMPAVLSLGALALPGGTGDATPRVVRLGRDGTVVLLNPDGSPGSTLASEVVTLAAASQPPASALFLKRTDSSVWAAGVGGSAGLLGLGVNQNRATPAEVETLRGASAISVGSSHALARMADGTVLGWGDGTRGQLAGAVTSAQPVAQAGVSQALAVLAVNDLSFALQQDGRVLAWGSGAAALGAGGTEARLQAQPQAVQTATSATLGEVLALSGFAGQADATLAALRSDGTVWTWGDNTRGGLGAPGPSRALAAPVAGISSIVGLAATDGGFVAIDASGALYFWGSVPVAGDTGRPTAYSDPYAPRRLDGAPAARSVQAAFSGLYQARLYTQDGFRWQTDGLSARETDPASELETRTLSTGILTIAAVASDDLVNAAERSAGVVVSGTISEADRPVTVELGTSRIAAQVSGTGWTATLPATALPTTGPVTFSASFVLGSGATSARTTRTITVDSIAPTVNIADDVPGTANAVVTYTFTWSEPPTGFGPGAVTVSGGTKGAFSQVSATTFTLQVVPTANAIGEIVMTLAQGVARDGAGNLSVGPVTARQAFKTDFAQPTLNISDDSGGIARGPVTVTFSWSEPVSGFTADDIGVANAAKGALTVLDTRNYSMVLTPQGTRGTISVSVAAGAVRDAADNASTAAFARAIEFDTELFTYDYGGGNGGGDSGGDGGSAGDAGAPGVLPATPVVTATADSGRLRLTWDRPPVIGNDPNTNIAYYLVLERDSETSTLTRFVNRISVSAGTPLNARFSVLVGGTNPNASYRIRACNGGSGSTGQGDRPGENWCTDSREFRSNGIAYPPEYFYPDGTNPNGNVVVVSINSTGSGFKTGPFTVNFNWNTTVGEFRADDISVDRGTISDFAGSGSQYTALVTPPANLSGTLVVTVRTGAVRSVVSGESAATTAQFSFGTLQTTNTGGRAGELAVLAGYPTLFSEVARIDGTGLDARFQDAMQMAFDGSGTLYVSDYPTIRRISSSGVVTTQTLTIAGPTVNPVDGTLSTATIRAATALTAGGAGVVYFADSFNDGVRIRRLSASGITTLVGAPQGIATVDGLAYDAPRNLLYVADRIRNVIWRVALSPTPSATVFAGALDVEGAQDGTGTAARFRRPYDVAVNASGVVYVADMDNNVIRRIVPSGTVGIVSVYAGAFGPFGASVDALLPGDARFGAPKALTVDANNNVYVVEPFNHAVRRISPTGAVTTILGNGSPGLVLGPVPGGLFLPQDVAVISGQTLAILGFGVIDPVNTGRGFGGMVFIARPATEWP